MGTELLNHIFGNSLLNHAIMNDLERTNAKIFFYPLVRDALAPFISNLSYQENNIEYYIKNESNLQIKCNINWLKKVDPANRLKNAFTVDAVLPDNSVLITIPIPYMYKDDTKKILLGQYSKIEKLKELYSDRSLAMLVCTKRPEIVEFFSVLSNFLDVDILSFAAENEIFHKFAEKDYFKYENNLDF